MVDNPYAVPNAQLSTTPANSPETGGEELDVGTVLSHAWEKVDGAKMPFFVVMVVVGGVALGITIVFGIVLAAIGDTSGDLATVFLLNFLPGLLTAVVTMPMMGGAIVMGVRRAAGQEVSAGTVFGYFDKLGPLLALYFMQTIVTYVGFILLILPGIYLSVALSMSIPLVVERGLGPIDAMVMSVKTVHSQWLQTFLIGLVLFFIIMVACLPLGLGLIWAGPLAMISTGEIYRRLFGLQPNAPPTAA